MEQKKTATAMGICNCKLWVRPAAPAVGEAAESPTRTSTRRITGMAAVYWGRGLAPRTEVRRATARAGATELPRTGITISVLLILLGLVTFLSLRARAKQSPARN